MDIVIPLTLPSGHSPAYRTGPRLFTCAIPITLLISRRNPLSFGSTELLSARLITSSTGDPLSHQRLSMSPMIMASWWPITALLFLRSQLRPGTNLTSHGHGESLPRSLRRQISGALIWRPPMHINNNSNVTKPLSHATSLSGQPLQFSAPNHTYNVSPTLRSGLHVVYKRNQPKAHKDGLPLSFLST